MTFYPSTLITPPVKEPVSVIEAKAHLDIAQTTNDDDPFITHLIEAARESFELDTVRQFISATWDVFRPEFPSDGIIELPHAPLQSVESVKYIDTDGAEQTLDPSLYSVDTASEPGQIVRAYNATWPATRSQKHPAAVTARIVAGYGDDAADVPAMLRSGIKFLVAHWFALREPVVVGTIIAKVPHNIESIIWQFKVEVYV